MMQHEIEQDTWKHAAGVAAARLVEDGMLLGIGTGTTAAHLIYALAERIHDGLRIAGAVPTSRASAELAGSLGIPLTDLDTHPFLDLAIDGTDEIDPQLRLIKGGGGALLREKIVASVSRRFIVIGDVSKQVSQLGHKMPLPVEVVPFGATPVLKRLQALGALVEIRRFDGQLFLTDNHNFILDCSFPGGIADPAGLHARIKAIVGVVETGLFLDMAAQAIIGGPAGVTSIS
jgi:ribose 5-phosphate isomerase A